ncbi:MAG: hypothetical protein DSZ24_07615, partial [Thermodesulfatator sp.]
IFTRLGGRTPGPSLEDLKALARPEVTLVLFLSVHRAEEIERALLEKLSPETPVAVAEKLGFPEERLLFGRLAGLSQLVSEAEHRGGHFPWNKWGLWLEYASTHELCNKVFIFGLKYAQNYLIYSEASGYNLISRAERVLVF